MDHDLDSIINARLTHTTRFIYVKKNHVTVDTFLIKKVSRNNKDTSIVLTFSDRRTKKLKADEFWGVITDFGERRRFYNGRTYAVWRTEAPYFYKKTFNNKARYYFSETLTSPVFTLTEENINVNVIDPVTLKKMRLYIEDNKLAIIHTNDDAIDNAAGISMEVAAFLFQLTGLVLQTFLEFVK
ncbi:MAG: hypothetical protein V4580_03165 [Bacteroidota bacterium]